MNILCKWFGHLRPLRIATKDYIGGMVHNDIHSSTTGFKCLWCEEYWTEQWDW